MFFSTYFLILFPSAAISAYASPIPQPASLPPNLSITQPSNITSISNSNTRCVDRINPFTRRPKYADCTVAIRQLPQIPVAGSFHNQGTDDLFKLPVEKTFSSCIVRVELYAASSTVGGSWSGIGTRATGLNRRCLRTAFPIYKGGWATYAKDDRIVISLAYPEGSGGGESV